MDRGGEHPRVAVADSLAAGVAAVLHLDPATIPPLDPADEPAAIALLNRWLGSMALGVARVAGPENFAWPGPWIARITPAGQPARFVVMYGTPSGVILDPAGDAEGAPVPISHGYLIAAADIALARPPLPQAPSAPGTLEEIWIAPAAGTALTARRSVRAIPGVGLAGDRYASGAGTFPTGPPGSALTLIEAEVCESFTPALSAGDHRRNLVTRGVALNDLLGHQFTIGTVRCRGMRLCEPCTVVQRYAGRAVLRALAHRGGLRVDVLGDGELRVGDEIRAVAPDA